MCQPSALSGVGVVNDFSIIILVELNSKLNTSFYK